MQNLIYREWVTQNVYTWVKKKEGDVHLKILKLLHFKRNGTGPGLRAKCLLCASVPQ